MPFYLIKQKLTSRGYWDEAGADGGASGTGDTGAGTGVKDDDKSGENKSGDDKGDDKQGKPTDKEAELLKDVMKQKAKNKEAEATINSLKEQLQKFDGIDLDEVKSLIDSKKTEETRKLEEAGQWDALKKQMVEENAKLLKAKSDENAELRALVENQNKTINKLTLGHSFNTSSFISNELNLSAEKTRIIYGDHFELEGDKVVAYNKPKGAGDRAQLVDASGEPLPFEDALRKLVEGDPDKDRLIKVKAKQGSGSSTTNSKLDANAPKVTGLSRIEKALDGAQK